MTSRLPKDVQSQTYSGDLPASWNQVPENLRKPFWTIRECIRVSGCSRSTIDRWRDDPDSGFPAGRVACPSRGRGPNKGTVLLPSARVLQFLEGTN